MLLYGGEQGFQKKQERRRAVHASTGQPRFQPAFRGTPGFPPAFAGQQVPPIAGHGFVRGAHAENFKNTDDVSRC